MQKCLAQMCVFLFARFYWETSWFCRAQAHPPQNLNIHSLQTHTAPKLCLFGYNTPLSCPRPPRCPSPLPPCLSLRLWASVWEQWEHYCKAAMEKIIYNGAFLSPFLSPLKTLGTQHCPLLKGQRVFSTWVPGWDSQLLPLFPCSHWNLWSQSVPPERCVNVCRQWGSPSTTQARLHQHTLLHWTAEGNQQQQQLFRLQPVTSHTVWVEFGEYFQRNSTRLSRHKPSLTSLSRFWPWWLSLCL